MLEMSGAGPAFEKHWSHFANAGLLYLNSERNAFLTLYV
jgi:hypothetical protein